MSRRYNPPDVEFFDNWASYGTWLATRFPAEPAPNNLVPIDPTLFFVRAVTTVDRRTGRIRLRYSSVDFEP